MEFEYDSQKESDADSLGVEPDVELGNFPS